MRCSRLGDIRADHTDEYYVEGKRIDGIIYEHFPFIVKRCVGPCHRQLRVSNEISVALMTAILYRCYGSPASE